MHVRVGGSVERERERERKKEREKERERGLHTVNETIEINKMQREQTEMWAQRERKI